jgi:2,4-didehydro-3-deoxy-L-rhamnonate hydrolase
MRLCRYSLDSTAHIGLFCDETIVPIFEIARSVGATEIASHLAQVPDDMEHFLPPAGPGYAPLLKALGDGLDLSRLPHIAVDQVRILPPIARPPKLLLLAGNYVEHILEQGDLAAERANTFPYVFMKPPTTTLVGHNSEVCIPTISPLKIDYELELGVIIGRRGRNIPVASALDYVAGYTVINDISDRGFRPNPTRQERPRDKFFDWLHGKWHEGSCPCGPCLTTVEAITNPQDLSMKLSIDGRVRQDASTSLQVFSVAEVISFISSFITLELGDIISTGTPAGVGNATGEYLRPGQRIEATIAGIGTLVTTMVSEAPSH